MRKRRMRGSGCARVAPSACASRPLSYAEFRTGLTYREVYHMIWGRKWKRRHGVLGYWRELKIAMYRQHLYETGFGEENRAP